MKKQIDLLVKLQEKDRLLEKLEGQISGGPKRLKDLESQLESLEESYKAHKDRIQELLKTQRQYEGEIEDGIAHIRKSRGRLMSIKNNKEYHALIREIEETEKDNAAKEDKVIACLEELEKLNEELGDSENALASMGKSIDKDKRVIEEEVASMEKELAAGFCLGEGLVADLRNIALVRHCGRAVPDDAAEGDPLDVSRNRVDVTLIPGLSPALESTEGVQVIRSGCGRTEAGALAEDLAPVESQVTVQLETLRRLPGQITRQQAAYRVAGGIHAAAVFEPGA